MFSDFLIRISSPFIFNWMVSDLCWKRKLFFYELIILFCWVTHKRCDLPSFFNNYCHFFSFSFSSINAFDLDLSRGPSNLIQLSFVLVRESCHLERLKTEKIFFNKQISVVEVFPLLFNRRTFVRNSQERREVSYSSSSFRQGPILTILLFPLNYLFFL